MPEMDADAPVTDVVDTDETKNGSIEVDLDKPAAPAKLPEVPKEVLEQVTTQIREQLQKEFDGRLTPLKNQTEALRRQNERLQRELGQTTRPAPDAATTPATTEDELDRLVNEGKWKDAVGKIVQGHLTQWWEKVRVEEAVAQDTRQREQVRQVSQQRVMTLYPELDLATGDPDTEVSKVFVQVLNAYPDLQGNPRGPELAMYEMERILRDESGLAPRSLVKPASDAATAEAVRRTSAAVASTGPSRTAAISGKVLLSKEEKELCDFNGIPYDVYAKSKLAEKQGGIELT